VQKEIFDKNPAAPLSIYVVWFSMLSTDARSRWNWTSGTISDTRAIHYWDEKRVVGTLLGKEDNPMGETPGIAWDAFYLYGPDAEWKENPPQVVVRGATVRDEADALREKIEPLLKQQ
jgi:hypothetical protein